MAPRVYVRFNHRGSKRGVWHKVFEQLAKEADNENALIDSTIVRAHRTVPLVRVKKGRTRPRLQEASVPGSQQRGADQ